MFKKIEYFLYRLFYIKNILMSFQQEDAHNSTTAVVLLAAAYHNDEWLPGYRSSNGLTPRFKELDGIQFNINCEWDELHPLWQQEQLKTFQQYVDIYDASLSLRDMSEKVHELWMKLNSWQKEYNPELFVSYDDLPREQQEKDEKVVAILQANL